jgi:thiol-disulfide isomerase/thioredoxin
MIAAAAVLASCTHSSGPTYGVAQPTSGPLPTVSGRTVQGGTFVPAEYRGHVTVVNFWATWCAPCRREQPQLQRVWRHERGDGVVMVGVNYRDDAAAARDWVRTYDVGYPSVVDPSGSYAATFGFAGLPATYVADAQGQLRYRFYGAVTEPALERVLAQVRASG